jgi:hypothetical protein
MTTVSPHGLQVLGSPASRRSTDARAPARARVFARVADPNAARGIGTMSLDVLLLMAAVAAVAGAVLS